MTWPDEASTQFLLDWAASMSVLKRIQLISLAARWNVMHPLAAFSSSGAVISRTWRADHLSFLQGCGHGGSHPDLVHGFLVACLGQRSPMPDAETSVNWTMVGICAHQSAVAGGQKIAIDTF